jgi:hypothetical protein
LTAVAPLNPYAALSNPIVEGVFSALLLVSGLLAKSRSAQKKAADSLAEAIVVSGSTDKAMKVADTNGTVPLVSEHIANNTLTT